MITNAGGDVTRQRFDENRQPVSTTTAYGTSAATTRTMAYDADLNQVSVTDGNGDTTRASYDEAGNVIGQTDANGDTTRLSYDARRNVTSVTSPSGRVATMSYDGRGNLTRQASTLVRSGQSDQVQASTFAYDQDGLLVSSTNPLGRTWSYAYDDAGNMVSQTSPTGEKASFAYDGASRVIKSTSPRGNATGADPDQFSTVITRDALGLPTDVRDALGHHTATAYDAGYNPVRVTDAAGRATEISYDAESQPTRIERAGQVEQTEYDANGRVVAKVDGKGQTTQYKRDLAGRVIEVTDPLGRKSTQRYDPAGRLTGTTDALGRTTDLSYDAAGQTTGIDYSDAQTGDVTMGYDRDGRRVRTSDASGSSSYVYDSLDRLVSVTDGAGDTVAYGYDLADHQASVTYPGARTVTRQFDAGGRQTSLTDWLGNTTAFAYDADDNQTATSFASGAGDVDRYTYDRAGRMSAVEIDGAQGRLASSGLQRNGAGQVTSTTSTGLPGADGSFGYDAFGRLNAAGQDSYSFDAAANATRLGSTTDLTYDQAGQLQTATTPQGQVSYSFDAVGNRTETTPATGQPTRYGYDQAGGLRSVERDGQPTVGYRYDAAGLRTKKIRGSAITKLTWDTSTEVPLLLDDGENRYVYGPDGLPLEQITADGEVSFLHHDQLGSTSVVTDQQGRLLGSYRYDAYGKQTASPDAPATPFGFAGEYTDPDTGLIYLRARDYDPATGQFLIRDPLEDLTGQPYLYAGGDPVNSIDPLGLLPSLGQIGSYVSNAAAGVLNSASFGYSTKLAGRAFGFDSDCAEWGPGFGTGALAGNIVGPGKLRSAAKGAARGIRAANGGRRSSPILKSDPYSPESVARRQSDRRRDAGVNASPDTPLPNRGPGSDRGGHSADPTDSHPTGERNVGAEEHSRVAKGRGGRGPRG